MRLDPATRRALLVEAASGVFRGRDPSDVSFEEVAEAKLIQPTFITNYPTEVSPLSRKSDHDPEYVDRFEFFYLAICLIGGTVSQLMAPETTGLSLSPPRRCARGPRNDPLLQPRLSRGVRRHRSIDGTSASTFA